MQENTQAHCQAKKQEAGFGTIENAEAIDSYKKTLVRSLKALKPKRVFEYGPGISTEIIQSFADSIDSLEHSLKWFNKWRGKWSFSNVNLIYDNENEGYCDCLKFYGKYFGKYDLIFIDGIVRETILKFAGQYLSKEGYIILHDAQRDRYKNGIDKYKYKFIEDKGCTALLTNSKEVHDKYASSYTSA